MTALIGITNLVFEPTGAAIAVPSVLPTTTIVISSTISVGLDRLLIAAVAVLVAVALVVVQRVGGLARWAYPS